TLGHYQESLIPSNFVTEFNGKRKRVNEKARVRSLRVRSSLPYKRNGGPLEADSLPSGMVKAVYISPPPYLVEDGIGYR
nr:hypothetical protein [Tanacetum cinerariifolium]